MSLPFSTAGSDYEPIQPTNENFTGHRLRYPSSSTLPRDDDTLRVMIINDDERETDEIFQIFLVEVRINAYVVKPIGTITIVDDDTQIIDCKSVFSVSPSYIQWLLTVSLCSV